VTSTASTKTNSNHNTFGNNRFKLGLFCANCNGGMTFSTAPERWKADWDDIVTVSKLADDAGIEFILPVAKWRGFGGESDLWGRSFEVLTHSAAIGALTKRIGIFATVHVPLVSPAFAAKALATLDHVTHGRAGLNIVCGWNQEEFDLHGVTIDPEQRYNQGLEWYEVYAKLLEGGPPFDWNGQFYKLKGLSTNPLSIQKPRPVVMSAGYSTKGRDFAAKTADLLFTNPGEWSHGKALVRSVKDNSARYQRDVDVYASCFFICRPSRKEAEDYYFHVAEELADRKATAHFTRQRIATATDGETPASNAAAVAVLQRHEPAMGKTYSGSIPGVHPVIGSPDDVVAELAKLQEIGLAGSSMTFVNYLDEMPFFLQEVLPRMEKAGLRMPDKNVKAPGPA
jgi:alkanesulfonate monooxygenase SsuD/methylene tetrahydromethanopterin reductase-like flavin-dependent oxidoreductase (luciferase family)